MTMSRKETELYNQVVGEMSLEVMSLVVESAEEILKDQKIVHKAIMIDSLVDYANTLYLQKLKSRLPHEIYERKHKLFNKHNIKVWLKPLKLVEVIGYDKATKTQYRAWTKNNG